MKRKVKIRGRIIRILDRSTVIINLGSDHGITRESIFSILGEPEPVIDPFTEEELGRVSVVKGRVKAKTVTPRFTIATSKWLEERFIPSVSLDMERMLGVEREVQPIGNELRVAPEDVQPWRAETEDLVRVGDEVEVEVEIEEGETGGGESRENNNGI